MNGPNEIRNINTARAKQALDGLLSKAILAEQQGHPKAPEFRRQYEGLAAELNG